MIQKTFNVFFTTQFYLPESHLLNMTEHHRPKVCFSDFLETCLHASLIGVRIMLTPDAVIVEPCPFTYTNLNRLMQRSPKKQTTYCNFQTRDLDFCFFASKIKCDRVFVTRYLWYHYETTVNIARNFLETHYYPITHNNMVFRHLNEIILLWVILVTFL